MDCGIYKIENLVTKDCYIGQSIRLRKRLIQHLGDLKDGRHCNIHFQRAFLEYRHENFIFKVILYCEPFELTRYEQTLVNLLEPTYNILRLCVNSRIGIKHSKEAKIKMSKVHKGVHLSEEHRHKISESNKGQTPCTKGKKTSTETKQKISEKRMGHSVSEETRLKISNARKGKGTYPWTEDRKKKVSESLMGHFVSEETRVKMSKSLTGRVAWNKGHKGLKETEETKLKKSKATKARYMALNLMEIET